MNESQDKPHDAELDELLARHRERLRRMVRLRMDPRLQGRIDASDVIQDAFLEATLRYEAYCLQPEMPFYLWLRFITGQRLLRVHRQHLGVQARDAAREVSIFQARIPEATSAALAAQLVGRHTTPSEAAVRAERKAAVQHALNQMDPLDREVLALRHFEQLSNAEVAQVLDLQESAASKRYIRGLKKLKVVLSVES